MTTAKQKIFLSHITEEAELSALLKSEIENKFPSLVDVFVSSHPDSIGLGDAWLSEITQGLMSCSLMLVLCSPYSIKRPWINFESGVGWARKILVIPICHSGLGLSELPLPLKLIQGVQIDKTGDVLSLIANSLGIVGQKFDTKIIDSKICAFEAKYTESLLIAKHLNEIKQSSSDLLEALAKVQPNHITEIKDVPERIIQVVRQALDALKKSGFLEWKYGVIGMQFVSGGGAGGGTIGILTVVIDARLSRAIRGMTQ